MSARRGVVVAVLLALVECIVAAPVPKPGTNSRATPQACFATAQRAQKKKDWKTVLACLTDESREAVAGQCATALVHLSTLRLPDAATIKSKLSALLKKHGLTVAEVKKVRRRLALMAELDGQGTKELR